jgi:hypothetical protein
MSAFNFHTLKLFDRRKAAGLPEAQALVLAEAQKDAFSDALAGRTQGLEHALEDHGVLHALGALAWVQHRGDDLPRKTLEEKQRRVAVGD